MTAFVNERQALRVSRLHNHRAREMCFEVIKIVELARREIESLRSSFEVHRVAFVYEQSLSLEDGRA